MQIIVRPSQFLLFAKGHGYCSVALSKMNLLYAPQSSSGTFSFRPISETGRIDMSISLLALSQNRGTNILFGSDSYMVERVVRG